MRIKLFTLTELGKYGQIHGSDYAWRKERGLIVEELAGELLYDRDRYKATA